MLHLVRYLCPDIAVNRQFRKYTSDDYVVAICLLGNLRVFYVFIVIPPTNKVCAFASCIIGQ